MVETDPEIPLHKINPDAPVLQLLADGQELLRISKSLLRSDADYFILAEARDGIALSTAVKIAAKGTKRMKMTFHSGDPTQFPTEAADEIVQATGGDAKRMTQRVAGSFDYVFHFIQLADKRQKRLKSIYEMCVDKDGVIVMEPMCEYDVRTDAWVFYERMKEVHCTYAQDADPTAYEQMKNILCELATASPVKSMSAKKSAEVNS
jgi:pilus assembly protein CpaF